MFDREPAIISGVNGRVLGVDFIVFLRVLRIGSLNGFKGAELIFPDKIYKQ